MSCYFIVNAYPSSLGDEFVTVGVLVPAEDGMLLREYVTGARLERARVFVGGEILWAFLAADSLLTKEHAQHAATNWYGCLRVANARGSTMSPDALLESVAASFLRGAR